MIPAVLRNRAFARLWAAQSITQFGGQLLFLALPMAAWQSTGSSMSFGAVFMASSAGIVLTMLVGGALADRFDRQRMMLMSDAAMVVTVAALGAAVLAERWWLVAVLAFVQTTTASLLRAGEALRRDLLADDERVQAAALGHFSLNASNLVAPVLGMAMFAWWGFLPILVIDLVTSAISFLLLLGVRDPRRHDRRVDLPVRDVMRRVVSDVRGGVAVVTHDRWLRAQVPGNLVSAFANGMFIVAVIPWIDGTLHLPASMFGVIIAIVGGSGLVASIVVARIHGRIEPTGLIMVGGALGFVGATAFVVPPSLPVLFAALTLFGVTNVMINVGVTTIRQGRFDGDLQGRLGSLEMVSGQLLGLFGMGTAAVLADHVDPAVPIACMGVGVCISCVGDMHATRVHRRHPVVAADLAATDGDLAISG